mgnify:CR=1 FL=1
MNIYRMSEAGICPRVLAAQQLGHTGIVNSEELKRLDYFSTLEHIVAAMLVAEGFEVSDSTMCPICIDKINEKDVRSGYHVEINTVLFNLVGHLDRRVRINGIWYPCEIKSLGRFSFDKFKQKAD